MSSHTRRSAEGHSDGLEQALAVIDARLASISRATPVILGWSVTQAKLRLLHDIRRQLTAIRDQNAPGSALRSASGIPITRRRT